MLETSSTLALEVSADTSASTQQKQSQREKLADVVNEALNSVDSISASLVETAATTIRNYTTDYLSLNEAAYTKTVQSLDKLADALVTSTETEDS